LKIVVLGFITPGRPPREPVTFEDGWLSHFVFLFLSSAKKINLYFWADKFIVLQWQYLNLHHCIKSLSPMFSTLDHSVYGVKGHFQQYFSYIMAVSFIGWGNRSGAVRSWSFCSWIYNYLCKQCLSPLKWVRTPFMARFTRYNIML
jgi:hypothetical protein